MTEPVRVEPPPTRCQCVLVYPGEDPKDSQCTQRTAGADVPFCGDCETRHPERAGREVAVTVAIPVRLGWGPGDKVAPDSVTD